VQRQKAAVAVFDLTEEHLSKAQVVGSARHQPSDAGEQSGFSVTSGGIRASPPAPRQPFTQRLDSLLV
jgi:hypothetical protein